MPTAQAAAVVEASLALLGPDDPLAISWGGMIHRGVDYGLVFVSGAWRWWILPWASAIGALVCAVPLVGGALDAVGNPA